MGAESSRRDKNICAGDPGRLRSRFPAVDRGNHFVDDRIGGLLVKAIELGGRQRSGDARAIVGVIDGEDVVLLVDVRADIECGSQPPATRRKYETVVSQVIVAVANAYIEDHAAEQLCQVACNACRIAVFPQELRHLEVAGAVAMVLSEQGQRRGIEPASTRGAVEATHAEGPERMIERDQPGLRYHDACLLRQVVGDEFPGANVTVVVPRRELGYPELAVALREVCLGPGASQRGPRGYKDRKPSPQGVEVVDLPGGQGQRNISEFCQAGDRRRRQGLCGKEGVRPLMTKPQRSPGG